MGLRFALEQHWVQLQVSILLRFTHMRSGRSGRREANLALVLCGIVVTFVLCHIPRVILSVHEFILIEDIIRYIRDCRTLIKETIEVQIMFQM